MRNSAYQMLITQDCNSINKKKIWNVIKNTFSSNAQ